MEGVHLNEIGRKQAEVVAHSPVLGEVQAIYTSPLSRCQETAEPLGRKRGLEPIVEDDLLEVDFGQWTGMALAELEDEERWRMYHHLRAGHRPPGGEAPQEVQTRMVRFAERMRKAHPNAEVAAFSHGDPIRTLLAWAAGTSLDLMLRFDVDLASISTIDIEEWNVCIRTANLRPDF